MFIIIMLVHVPVRSDWGSGPESAQPRFIYRKMFELELNMLFPPSSQLPELKPHLGETRTGLDAWISIINTAA